ncbi:FKBP-type peptidyl-prolyl cis-trans isomerase [Patulibacter sp. S7RM1-6]
MHLRRLAPVPLLVLALAAAGCGDERTAADVSKGDTEQSAGATARSGGVDALAGAISTDLDTEPKIVKVSGEAPTSLVKKDIVTGDGETAKVGDTVEVRYSLVVWGDDQKVDSSWDRTPNSTSFPLEEGGLIDGWIQGVPGMKVGGRRLLVVPPEQGYGAQGTPDGSVPPNSTLIFVIDLVKTGQGG